MRGLMDTLGIGERIAWYRRRRDVSQEVLAGLIGRATDWLSKVENGHIMLDRRSVIKALTDQLDVRIGDLIAEPSLLDWAADVNSSTVPRCVKPSWTTARPRPDRHPPRE